MARARGRAAIGGGAGISVGRHTTFNLIGALASIAVMLGTVPALLAVAGLERFGVLGVATSFLLYFGLFDFGLSRAAARRLAVIEAGRPAALSGVIWTVLPLNLALGLAGALLLAAGSWWYFDAVMELDPALRAEAIASVGWLAAALPPTVLAGLFSGALQARQRFLALNLLNVGGLTLLQVLPLALAWLVAPTLDMMMLGVFAARVITIVALALAIHAVAAPLLPLRRPERGLAREMFAFGGWVSVSAVVGPLMTAADRALLGAFAGASAVALYTVPAGLVRRVEVLPMALSSAIFPRLVGERDPKARFRLLSLTVAATSAATVPMIVAGGVILSPFLALWIDPDFARHAAPVGALLLAGFWAKAHVYAPYEILHAQGRPDLVAKVHLAVAPPYIALVAACAIAFGAVGVAAVWSVRAIVDFAALFLLATGGDIAPLRSRLAIPAALILATVALTILAPPDGAARWAVGVALTAAALVWSWRATPEEIRARALALLRR